MNAHEITIRPERRGILHLAVGIAAISALTLASFAVAQDRPSRGITDTERAERAEQIRERREQAREQHADRMSDATLLGQRVAVMVGEGLHDMETLAPIAYLTNRGARVTVIGIEPGLVKAYNSDIKIRVEQAVSRVNPQQFDALVLPGGQGPAKLREDDGAVRFARAFFESGKPVAAICHGPQVLVTAGVLEGKSATCIAAISSELEEAGANYDDKPVIVDGNLITSRLPEDIPAFVKALEEQMIDYRAGLREERMRDRGREREDGARERSRDRGRDERRGRDRGGRR